MRLLHRPALAALLASLASVPLAAAPELLLPDLIVRRADLHDRTIDSSTIPGRTLLRFSNGVANIGRGNFEFAGVFPPNPDGSHAVIQRIYRSDGSVLERDAGIFSFRDAEHELRIGAWIQYRLRALLDGDGVGEVLRETRKTSFCISDVRHYSRDLPNFRPIAMYRSCSATVQGISVGWIDVYSRELITQRIDITGIPDGEYWLESEVDPDDHFLEANEENNITRVKIVLGNPVSAPDRYEPDDTLQDVLDQPLGGDTSPNIGPADPKRVIDATVLPGDVDLYRFYANETGGEGDFVRLDFDPVAGALDLALLEPGGREVERAQVERGRAVISLEGRGEGWYLARVSGGDGGAAGAYRLTINPPENEPPQIDVLTPPPEGADRVQGIEFYTVEWSFSDPEGDETWVSVFLNERPVPDANIVPVRSAQRIEAAAGEAHINGAEFPAGTYYVLCQITDGGRTTGAWAPGPITFHFFGRACRDVPGPERDCNGNDVLDTCEIDRGLLRDCDGDAVPDRCQIDADPLLDRNGNGVPDRCESRFHRGDAGDDGALTLVDPLVILNFLFLGGPRPSCLEAADADNDGEISIADGVFLLLYLFDGGEPPAAPGPPGTPCGADPDERGSSGDLGCASYASCAAE